MSQWLLGSDSSSEDGNEYSGDSISSQETKQGAKKNSENTEAQNAGVSLFAALFPSESDSGSDDDSVEKEERGGPSAAPMDISKSSFGDDKTSSFGELFASSSGSDGEVEDLEDSDSGVGQVSVRVAAAPSSSSVKRESIQGMGSRVAPMNIQKSTSGSSKHPKEEIFPPQLVDTLEELHEKLPVPIFMPPKIPPGQRRSEGGEGFRPEVRPTGRERKKTRFQKRRQTSVMRATRMNRHDTAVALSFDRVEDDDVRDYIPSIPRLNPQNRDPNRSHHEKIRSQSPPPEALVQPQVSHVSDKPGRRAKHNSLSEIVGHPPGKRFVHRRNMDFARTSGVAESLAGFGGQVEAGNPNQRRTQPQGNGAACMSALAYVGAERQKRHAPEKVAASQKEANLPIPHIRPSTEKFVIDPRLAQHIAPPVSVPEEPLDSTEGEAGVPDPAKFPVYTGKGEVEYVDESKDEPVDVGDALSYIAANFVPGAPLNRTDPLGAAVRNLSLLEPCGAREHRGRISMAGDDTHDPVKSGNTLTAMREMAAVTKRKPGSLGGAAPTLPDSLDLDTPEGQEIALKATEQMMEETFGSIDFISTMNRVAQQARAQAGNATDVSLPVLARDRVRRVIRGELDVHSLTPPELQLFNAAQSLGVTVDAYLDLMKRVADKSNKVVRGAVREGNEYANAVAKIKLVCGFDGSLRNKGLKRFLVQGAKARKLTQGEILTGAGAAGLAPEEWVNEAAGPLKQFIQYLPETCAASSLGVYVLSQMKDTDAAATYARLEMDPGVVSTWIPRAYFEEYARTARDDHSETPCSRGSSCAFYRLYPARIPEHERRPGIAMNIPDLDQWTGFSYYKRWPRAEIVTFCRTMCGTFAALATATMFSKPEQVHASLLALAENPDFNAEIEARKLWDVYGLPVDMASTPTDNPYSDVDWDNLDEAEIKNGRALALRARGELISVLLRNYGYYAKRQSQGHEVLVPSLTQEEVLAAVADAARMLSPTQIVQYRIDLLRLPEMLVKEVGRLARAAAIDKAAVVEVVNRKHLEGERQRVRTQAAMNSAGPSDGSVPSVKAVHEPPRGRAATLNPAHTHVPSNHTSNIPHWSSEFTLALRRILVADSPLAISEEDPVWTGKEGVPASTATHGLDEEGYHTVETSPSRREVDLMKDPRGALNKMGKAGVEDLLYKSVISTTNAARLQPGSDPLGKGMFGEVVDNVIPEPKLPPPKKSKTWNGYCALCLIYETHEKQVVCTASNSRKLFPVPSGPYHVQIKPDEFAVEATACPEQSFGGDTHPVLAFADHNFALSYDEEEGWWKAKFLYAKPNTWAEAHDPNFYELPLNAASR